MIFEIFKNVKYFSLITRAVRLTVRLFQKGVTTPELTGMSKMNRNEMEWTGMAGWNETGMDQMNRNELEWTGMDQNEPE